MADLSDPQNPNLTTPQETPGINENLGSPLSSQAIPNPVPQPSILPQPVSSFQEDVTSVSPPVIEIPTTLPEPPVAQPAPYNQESPNQPIGTTEASQTPPFQPTEPQVQPPQVDFNRPISSPTPLQTINEPIPAPVSPQIETDPPVKTPEPSIPAIPVDVNIAKEPPAQPPAPPKPAQNPTEDTKEVSLALAPFWERTFAWVLDIMIVASTASFGLFLLNVSKLPTSKTQMPIIENTTQYLILGSSIGLIYFAIVLYPLAFTLAFKASLGKKILGISVTDKNGERLPFFKIFIRTFVGYSIIIATLFTGFFLALFDKNKQALDDKLAASYVIKEESARKFWVGFVFVLGAMLLPGPWAATVYFPQYLGIATSEEIIIETPLKVKPQESTQRETSGFNVLGTQTEGYSLFKDSQNDYSIEIPSNWRVTTEKRSGVAAIFYLPDNISQLIIQNPQTVDAHQMLDIKTEDLRENLAAETADLSMDKVEKILINGLEANLFEAVEKKEDKTFETTYLLVYKAPKIFVLKATTSAKTSEFISVLDKTFRSFR